MEEELSRAYYPPYSSKLCRCNRDPGGNQKRVESSIEAIGSNRARAKKCDMRPSTKLDLPQPDHLLGRLALRGGMARIQEVLQKG